MSNSYDIVAMGAGHNGLVAAAYLAKAGKKVLVLERKAWPGGGVVTRQLNTPGYWHDEHSSVHIMIQGNPMLTQDELGLLSKHGLKYRYSDVPHATIFPDQSTLVTYKDVDKTCESIAKVSGRDAEAYRRFAQLGMSLLPMLMPGLYMPPPPLGETVAMLDRSDEGRLVLDLMQRSVLDVVKQWFQHERVQMHLVRAVTENLQLPDELGAGLIAILFPAIMHSYGVSQPYGGSGKLTESLVRCIEHHGGEVRCNAEVRRILVSSGRAVGVELTDGERFSARDAVIGAIHPHRLRQFVEGVPPPVLTRAERATLAPFSLFVCHYDLKQRIRFRTNDEAVERAIMLSLLATDRMSEMLADFDELKQGRVSRRRLVAGNDESISDPSRVPPGCGMWHGTGFAPYDLAEGGSARWDSYKEEFADLQEAAFRDFVSNLTADNIVARKVFSPVDLERGSPNSMVRGDVHGVAPYFYQSAGHRPTPDLGQYTVPGVDRLYLVGPFMHPGGGVFGAGRATAIKMFDDLKMDFERTVAGRAGEAASAQGLARARAPARARSPIAPAAAATAAVAAGPAEPGMRLFGAANEEIMAVSSIERDGDSLLIKGKSLGTMPLTARLDPEQARAGLRLMGLKLLAFLLTLPFRRSRRRALETKTSE
jgi:phytoene dehydrogenase-like protein